MDYSDFSRESLCVSRGQLPVWFEAPGVGLPTVWNSSDSVRHPRKAHTLTRLPFVPINLGHQHAVRCPDAQLFVPTQRETGPAVLLQLDFQVSALWDYQFVREGNPLGCVLQIVGHHEVGQRYLLARGVVQLEPVQRIAFGSHLVYD